MDEAEKNADIGETQEVLTPLPRPYEGRPSHNAHPPEEKLRAVALIAQKGPGAAAEETGIPLRTVQTWAREYREEIEMLRENEFVEEIDRKIKDILQEIDVSKIKSASFRDLLIGLGISIDKRSQLLDQRKKAKTAPVRLRVAWKDGAGAVELETKE